MSGMESVHLVQSPRLTVTVANPDMFAENLRRYALSPRMRELDRTPGWRWRKRRRLRENIEGTRDILARLAGEA